MSTLSYQEAKSRLSNDAEEGGYGWTIAAIIGAVVVTAIAMGTYYEYQPASPVPDDFRPTVD